MVRLGGAGAVGAYRIIRRAQPGYRRSERGHASTRITPGPEGDEVGVAYVFVRNNNVWTPGSPNAFRSRFNPGSFPCSCIEGASPLLRRGPIELFVVIVHGAIPLGKFLGRERKVVRGE